MSDDTQTRLKDTFPGVLVIKEPPKDEISLLPKYIQEWVLSRFIDPNTQKMDTNKLIDFVREKIPTPRKKQKFLAQLKEERILRVIAEFQAKVDISGDKYVLEIPVLNISGTIVDKIVRENPQLLLEGLWGAGTLDLDDLDNTIRLIEIKPLQVSRIDLEAFIEGRRNFSSDEWLDILFYSYGLNPDNYTRRQKLVFILRIIPMVETNTHLAEFGPKQTGKTYLFRNISSHSRVISGGQLSPAVLFYHLGRNTPGLLACYDTLVFDEISFIKFGHGDEIVGKLKDYMDSGNYDRGKQKVPSEASIVMVGNLVMGQDSNPAGALSTYFPEIMRDTAFMDRLCGFIPGWELPKIGKSSEHLARNVLGFATDYLSEIYNNFRECNYQSFFRKRIKFGPDLKIREEKAILKIASGLLKIIYPDKIITEEELKEIIDLAVECRQYVLIEQTNLQPAEFPEREIKWYLKDSEFK